MTRGGRIVLRLLTHGMELSWLSAWALFTTGLLAPRSFPLLEATLAFLGAFALTRLSTGRGWLVLGVLGLQAGGLLVAAAGFLHAASGRTAPLLDPAWLQALLAAPRTPVAWLPLFLGLAWFLGFWWGGVALARRPLEYGAICVRFDIGIGLFLGLFLFRWTADTSGDVAADPLSPFFLLPFLLSGLAAMGTVRLAGDGRTRFLPGVRGIGICLAFVLAALLVAAASATFLLPVLTLAAEAGLVVLQGTAAFLSPALLWILRFLFAPHTLRTDPAAAPPDRGVEGLLAGQEPHGWWFALVERIMAWAMLAAVILAGLLLAGLAVHALWRFLLSRTARGAAGRSRWHAVLAWLRRLWATTARLPGRRRAGDYYAALLAWARRGGYPPAQAETPAEFAGRLGLSFPRLAAEIGLIVESFQQEVYGEVALEEERLAAVASAWRRLRSVRHWPLRAREWLWG